MISAHVFNHCIFDCNNSGTFMNLIYIDALTGIAGYRAMLTDPNAFGSFLLAQFCLVLLLCKPLAILLDRFALLYFPDKLAANVFALFLFFLFLLFLFLFLL